MTKLFTRKLKSSFLVLLYSSHHTCLFDFLADTTYYTPYYFEERAIQVINHYHIQTCTRTQTQKRPLHKHTHAYTYIHIHSHTPAETHLSMKINFSQYKSLVLLPLYSHTFGPMYRKLLQDTFAAIWSDQVWNAQRISFFT